VTLLLQIAATLIVAHALAFVARRLRQPSVVGEIAAGIVLGPTILGALWPAAFHTIFPPGSLGPLKLLAEIGVVLFMFRVGLEVDLGALRRSTRQVAAISAVSIAVPFALGAALSFALIPPGKSPLVFTVFFGVAMAITAFPVMARILAERGMTATPVGRMALACAAINDLVAWMLLAAVVAAVKGGQGSVGLGVYGVFAAFVAGVIVPLDPERLKRFSIVTAALLPLFFAYVGVRTQIALLLDASSILLCLAVIVIATIGKLGSAGLAAWRTGMAPRDAFALGALMNTRGLMELVALNIGYELGILTPAIFAIFVVRALVTTIATGPLLDAARGR
jgi:Kef-type K+ transport system membrane component KefB